MITRAREQSNDKSTGWNGEYDLVSPGVSNAVERSALTAATSEEFITGALSAIKVIQSKSLSTGDAYIHASLGTEVIWSILTSKAHRRLVEVGADPISRQSQLDQWVMRRKNELLRESLKDLLTELSSRFGLPWVDIARYANVSVPAVRKWRMGGQASRENIDALLDLTATLEAAERVNVADPARWLFTPISRDVSVSPGDILRLVSISEFISLLSGVRTPEEILDHKEPTWRERFKREYRVQITSDGDGAIVRD